MKITQNGIYNFPHKFEIEYLSLFHRNDVPACDDKKYMLRTILARCHILLITMNESLSETHETVIQRNVVLHYIG